MNRAVVSLPAKQEYMAEPVFYDPRRARWKRLRRLIDVTAVVVSALIIFFVYTALRDEPLPELLFSPQKRAFKGLKESEKEKARERARKAAARSHRKSKLAASQVKLNQEEGIRAAFYVPWDAASFSSLRDYARQIDILYPDWLHVFTADGHLQGVDDQTNKYFDIVQGDTVRPVDDRVMTMIIVLTLPCAIRLSRMMLARPTALQPLASSL